MNIVEDRSRFTPQADAEGWLAAFEAALRAQDAAAAAALFLPDGLWRDLLAFTWTIQTMSGRPEIEAALAPHARAHKAFEFPYSAPADAAAPGQPRRHRIDRGDLQIRDRVRSG
jgi:putative flavoprotein involved in K+ transport